MLYTRISRNVMNTVFTFVDLGTTTVMQKIANVCSANGQEPVKYWSIIFLLHINLHQLMLVGTLSI